MGSIASIIGSKITKASLDVVLKATTFGFNLFRRSLLDVIKALSDFTKTLLETQQSLGVNLSSAARVQLDAFKSSFDSVFKVFDQFSQGIPTSAKDIFGEMISTITSTAGTVSGNLMSGVVSGDFNLENSLKEIRTGYQTFIGSAEKAAKQVTGKKVEVYVSPEEFVKARATIQEEFGVIPIKEVSDEYAKFAKENGLSIETLVKARRTFSTILMGDLSRTDELRAQIIAKFKQQNISQKVALEQIVKYSEIFARNGMRFADSFVRAAADAKKIGVDLSKIDQIGDNIIDDFEGFLEKQAELGAMGFDFDTNKLAQLAETGDTGALFNELRSQLAATGKDITKLRRSERLALEGAFGISISDMLKLSGATPKEKTQEELLENNNSTLAQILAALQAMGPVFDIIKMGIEIRLIGYLAGLLKTVDQILELLGGKDKQKLEEFRKRRDKEIEINKDSIQLYQDNTGTIRYRVDWMGNRIPINPPTTTEPTTPPVKRASGGLVSGKGTGTSDSIPARLSNGEYVMNAQSVKAFGLNFMNMINSRTGSFNIEELVNRKVEGLLNKFMGTNVGNIVSKVQGFATEGGSGLLAKAQSFLGEKVGGLLNKFMGTKTGGVVSQAQGIFSGGSTGLLDKAQGLLGKIPGVSGLLGKATNLLSGGGLKGLATSTLSKFGLGGLLGGAATGPLGMIGSLAAPLLKKIPLVGPLFGKISETPSKLIGSAIGQVSKLASKAFGGLFGKKKKSTEPIPMMPEMMSMDGTDLSMLLRDQILPQPTSTPQAPIVVDTSGIEQKLNNFIAALQNIQINMDGTQVGKVLVNTSDAATLAGVFRVQSR